MIAKKIRVLSLLSFFMLFLIPGQIEAGYPMKYNLDNGLEVILIENHNAPVTSMLVWVKVGSASEGPDEIGLAHLMEHMLFKGTKTRGPGEIAREIEAAGGHINAYTSFDQTVYHLDLASRFTRRGIEVLADMVFNPTMEPVEFKREKEVVVEEIKRSQDIPARRLSKQLFSESYKAHPYGRPIIGFADTVRGVTRKIGLDFHKKWYKPKNMILVLAGDFKAKDIKPVIAETFGKQKDRGITADKRPKEPVQKKARAFILKEDVKTARLDMAFHIPGIKHEDTTPLDVLAVILGQGRTSRLYREVKRNKELAFSVYSGAYTLKDPGIFLVDAALSADSVLETIKAILEETSRLGSSEAQSDELTRAKLKIQADFIRSRATMSGETRIAASYQAMLGDFRAKDQYLAEVERVTAGDIMRVAARYLKTDNMTVGVNYPKDAKNKLTVDDILATVASATDSAENEPVVKYTLDNGATLLIKQDKFLPLVSVRIAFLGGLRFENKGNNGLNNFLAEVWDHGTKRLSAEELSLAVEDMAGSISSFSGRNSFGLTGDFLSRYLDEGLNLLTEVLLEPALSAEEVKRARPNIIASIKRQQESLPFRTFNLFGKTLYGTHPYAFNALGTIESVEKITADDIRKYFDKWALPENMVMAVVGDVDPGAIKTKMELLLKDWNGKSFKAPTLKKPAQIKKLKSVQDKIERAQAHLVLGFLTEGLESKDRFPLEVLDTILSGMGGRLFLDLRDKQSLAYTVQSMFRPGLEVGSFGIYIAFAPDKFDQVKKGITKVLDDVLKLPITDKELNSAKENILGTFEIGLQRHSSQASDLVFNELYGLGYDYRATYIEGVNAVTAEDIKRVAKKYLDMKKAVVASVGSVGPWDE